MDTHDTFSFQHEINFAVGLVFKRPKVEGSVTGIGIVFGSPDKSQQCQRYCEETSLNHDIRLVLKAGDVTGELQLEKVSDGTQLAKGIVNIDRKEIEEFLEEPFEDRKCVIVFGFNSRCDFVIVPSGTTEEYSAIVLENFDISFT